MSRLIDKLPLELELLIDKVNDNSYKRDKKFEEHKNTVVSVSELLKSPKYIQNILNKVPRQYIKRDKKELLSSVIGTIIHDKLEEVVKSELFITHSAEERKYKQYKNIWITGEFDGYNHEKNYIYDLKIIKKWTLDQIVNENYNPLLNIEDDMKYYPFTTKYKLQLSYYNWLNRFNANKGYIYMVLKDGSMFEPHKILEFDNLYNEKLLIQYLDYLLETKEETLCSENVRGYRPATYKLQRLSPRTNKYYTVRNSIVHSKEDFEIIKQTLYRNGDKIIEEEEKNMFCKSCVFFNHCFKGVSNV